MYSTFSMHSSSNSKLSVYFCHINSWNINMVFFSILSSYHACCIRGCLSQTCSLNKELCCISSFPPLTVVKSASLERVLWAKWTWTWWKTSKSKLTIGNGPKEFNPLTCRSYNWSFSNWCLWLDDKKIQCLFSV